MWHIRNRILVADIGVKVDNRRVSIKTCSSYEFLDDLTTAAGTKRICIEISSDFPDLGKTCRYRIKRMC